MSELDELLKRLSDVSTKTTVMGLAIGKTADQLHLAVRNGVIAIPLAEISDVRRLESLSSDSEVVEVDVEHPETIVQIRKVRPLFPGIRGNPAHGYAFEAAANTLTIDLSTKTLTATGGGWDQTDDGSSGGEPDDSPAHAFEFEPSQF